MAKKISKKQRLARREQRQAKWLKKTAPMSEHEVDSDKIAMAIMLGHEIYAAVYRSDTQIKVNCHGVMKDAKESSIEAFVRKNTPTDGPIITLKLTGLGQAEEMAEFLNDDRVLECTDFALTMMAASGEGFRLMNFADYKAKFEQAEKDAA